MVPNSDSAVIMPEEFGYLSTLIKRYGWVQLLKDHEHLMATISPVEVRELARAYNKIESRGDAERLSHWIRANSKRPQEKAAKFAMFQLLCIFDDLAERGVEPFMSRVVKYVPSPIAEPDWSELPRDLEYLIEPATKYGIHWSDGAVDSFLSQATDEEVGELARTAEAIRLAEDAPVINEWLNDRPITEFREAELVYFLLGLMDAMRLDWGG